jgi:hypothetical protein
MSVILSVNTAKTRNVVVTWFGNCSYRRLKVTYEVHKMLCPLCQHDLEDGLYFGSKVFAKDKNASDYVSSSWLPLVEDGREVWVVSPSDNFEEHVHHSSLPLIRKRMGS